MIITGQVKSLQESALTNLSFHQLSKSHHVLLDIIEDHARYDCQGLVVSVLAWSEGWIKLGKVRFQQLVGLLSKFPVCLLSDLFQLTTCLKLL